MNILSKTLGRIHNHKTKFSILCFVIFFIAILTIELFVHYYGDDYYFLTFVQGDFWKMHLFHYMHNNGRSIVHFLITIFLAADIRLWYVVNAIMLTVTTYFIHKLIGKRFLTAFISCAMILTMPISLTHESMFWITGALNYVYPSMLLIIYWYIISENNRRHNIGMYLTAFLLSASTEQGAVAVVTLTLCYILYNMFIQKNNTSKHLIIALIISLVGAATVFLAPGNLERMATEGVGETYTTVVRSIEFLMRNVFVADYTVLFNVVAVFVSAIYLRQRGFRVIPWLCIPLLILMIIGNKAGDIKSLARFAYMLITASVCLSCAGLYVITAIEYYKQTKSIKPAVAVIVGVCSSAFIIPSPTIGARILYMTDILFITYICSIAADALKCRRLFGVFVIVVGVAAICNWGVTLHGYYTNNRIYYENEKMIEEYKKYPSDMLIQKKLILEDYGWSMPYNSPYHEYYYKLYHRIPEETRIFWQ